MLKKTLVRLFIAATVVAASKSIAQAKEVSCMPIGPSRYPIFLVKEKESPLSYLLL
jgi:hypothetical protein